MTAGGVKAAQRRWRDNSQIGIFVYLMGGMLVLFIMVVVRFFSGSYSLYTDSVTAVAEVENVYERTRNHKRTTYDYRLTYEYNGITYTGVLKNSGRIVRNGEIDILINRSEPSDFIDAGNGNASFYKMLILVVAIYYSPLILLILIVSVTVKGKGD